MAVRSTCLAALNLTVIGTQAVYTVPVGKTTILKSLIVGTQAASPGYITASVVPAGGTAVIIARVNATAQYEPYEVSPYVVLEEGWELQVNHPSAADWVYASGSELQNGEA